MKPKITNETEYNRNNRNKQTQTSSRGGMNTLLICQVHHAHIKLQSKPREIPSLLAEQGHLLVTKQHTSLKKPYSW